MFTIGVTPDTLLIEGVTADAGQTAVADAAAMLHDRDIIAMTFAGEVRARAVQALLRLLTLDTE